MSDSALLKKAGFFALGLVALGFFAFWPMYQVTQGAASVSISFKGIAISALLTAMGLFSLLFGNRGIPMKKVKGQPLTPIQRIQLGATIVGTIVIIGLVWLFFSAHGYSMKF